MKTPSTALDGVKDCCWALTYLFMFLIYLITKKSSCVSQFLKDLM